MLTYVDSQQYYPVMPGFTKLFSTLVTSTIWREDHVTRVVWITMLALSDRWGYVAASVPGLAAMANVSVDDCRRAIARLKSTDPDSRTKDHDGRRIADADGGWNLLNYAKYRELGRSADRSEYLRLAQQKSRAKRAVNMSTNVNQCQPISEAEAEAEIRSERIGTDSAEVASPPSTPVLVFPCAGAVRSWSLHKDQLDHWQTLFPGVDVAAESRKALAWVESQPRQKKTASGMGRFLTSWFGRAQDRGGRPRGTGSRTEENLEVIRDWHYDRKSK